MIPITLHLMACVALAAASLYWRYHAPEGGSVYRKMLPFIIAPGFIGLLILYGYLMEFFVASYSGAIYDVSPLTPGHMAWIAVSLFLTLLPLVGLVPSIGRQALPMLAIACLAALPDVVSLVAHTGAQRA